MQGLVRIAAPAPFELWLADLHDPPSEAQLSALSDAERERAARFVFARDRRRYAAAHCALRHLLATRTTIPAGQLVFHEGPFGKPSLGHDAACAFNLSHSADMALVALAEAGEIGVDLEMLRPMPDAIDLARHNFSAPENAELVSTIYPFDAEVKQGVRDGGYRLHDDHLHDVPAFERAVKTALLSLASRSHQQPILIVDDGGTAATIIARDLAHLRCPDGRRRFEIVEVTRNGVRPIEALRGESPSARPTFWTGT